MHAIYLHGFGSSPQSAKGTALGAQLRGLVRSYAIPQLDGGDFSGMTMESIQERVIAAIAALPDDDAGLLLIGSSLGGYTAALLAGARQLPSQTLRKRPMAMLLIAPAFGFPERWRGILGPEGLAEWRRTGTRLFHNHAAERELPLGVDFLESCQGLPAIPPPAGCPVVIVHGRSDETVDWRASRAYAEQDEGIEFHLIAGDHRLTEPRHDDLIAWCARDVITRLCPVPS